MHVCVVCACVCVVCVLCVLCVLYVCMCVCAYDVRGQYVPSRHLSLYMGLDCSGHPNEYFMSMCVCGHLLKAVVTSKAVNRAWALIRNTSR